MSGTPKAPRTCDAGRLTPEGTIAVFATVQSEGDRQIHGETEHYSLDVKGKHDPDFFFHLP